MVIDVELLDELEEVLASLLFEETHQVTLDCLLIGGWDFLDLSSTGREETLLLHLVDVGSINGLPFEVLGYSSLEQKFYELSVGHDEFRDQVDVPVPVLAQIFWWFLFFSEVFP